MTKKFVLDATPVSWGNSSREVGERIAAGLIVMAVIPITAAVVLDVAMAIQFIRYAGNIAKDAREVIHIAPVGITAVLTTIGAGMYLRGLRNLLRKPAKSECVS